MNLDIDLPTPVIIIIIVLLVAAFGAMLWQTFFVGNPASPSGNQAQEIEKQEIINFLRNSGLIASFQGLTVADYYEFDRNSNQIFVWAYVSAYSESNGELKQESGVSLPLVLNISNGRITHYEKPRDGEEYAVDIRQMFPEKIQGDVLNFHTQHQEDLDNLIKTVEEKARQELSAGNFDKIISVGSTTTLKLSGNRTTGYQWHYIIKKDGIIEVISDEYQPEETEKKVVGAGGTRIIVLKGVTPGTTTINFKYYRTEETVEQTKEVMIKVKDKEISYDLPDDLGLNYTYLEDWEVTVNKNQSELVCEEESDESFYRQYRQEIENYNYCVEKTNEGAAGTVYENYQYSRAKAGNLITISFLLRYPRCSNYPEAEKTKCEKERNSFNLNKIVHRVFQSIKLN